VRGQLEADGTLSPAIELSDVAINAPLSEEPFRFNGSGDPKLPGAPTLPERSEPPVLELPPTGAGDGDDMNCEVWHTFRISDNAALIIWRRSAPIAKTNEAPDWLSGITMFASDPFTSKPFGSDPRGVRELRHHWVHQSNAADKWNWSLVVPADGKSLGCAEVFLRVEAPKSLTTLDATPLSFREQDLRELLHAAQSAMLPANSQEVSLPYLQAVGAKLPSGGH
jgi:hypothetical protein